MTPLELQILLHYYGCANDYRDGDFSAPAVREAIDQFRRDELLRPSELGETFVACYRLTERGQTFVEALCRTRLPVRRWVMPEKSDGQPS